MLSQLVLTCRHLRLAIGHFTLLTLASSKAYYQEKNLNEVAQAIKMAQKIPNFFGKNC